jgi:hypothetical protein
LRLLRQWLSPSQRSQFAEESCFEVVGGDTGKRYRIHAGAATNVCELDERGRPTLGLCFLPMGDLPIGDVMLSQKIALESAESYALRAARRFAPDGTFRRRRLLRSVDRLVLARDRGPIGRVESPTVTPDDWKQRISSHVAFQRDNEAMVAARDIVDRGNFIGVGLVSGWWPRMVEGPLQREMFR